MSHNMSKTSDASTGEHVRAHTRRHFLGGAGFGIGTLALANLIAKDAQAAGAKPPHFAPKAKNVIYLFMAGAPSTLDLLDHKPELVKRDGELCPESLLAGQRFAFIQGRPRLLGSPFAFARHGRAGHSLSELLPHTARVADEIAIVRSMHTTQFNHAPAQIFMNTGHQIVGRPSFGAWLSYGLGSEGQDLPAFTVLLSGEDNPDGGKSCWGAGYLPTEFQGVELRSSGDPVLHLSDPPGISRRSRERTLAALSELNTLRHAAVGDPEIKTRIAAYELGYRMQTSVPELMDVASEPASVHALYGTVPGKTSFANNCLLARRLVERGVRCVQLFHRGWDHHGSTANDDILTGLPALCLQIDRAAAALIQDLKRTGLLDETLVVWGGEFGRTPMNEERHGSKLLGRDHNPRAFSMWLAGGGIKPGVTVGRTDEFGYSVVEDAVHVHDLHATVLHLMGIDHTKLTYKFQGRDYRLTDVAGTVVKKLLA
jgi:hypothetical protein